MRLWVLTACASGLLLACSTGDGGYGITTTGSRRGGTVGSNGESAGTTGTSSTGTGTSSGGTTGTTASSSGTTGANCTPAQHSNLDDCPDGMVELVWLVIDLIHHAPLSTPASIYNFDNVTEVTTNDTCGNFHLCVMQGEPVAIAFEATNFFSEIAQTIVADQSGQLGNAMEVYGQDAAQLLPPPASTEINPSLSQVGVNIAGASCSSVGWSMWLEDSDGGVVDAGVLYGNGTTLSYGTQTTGQGGVLFFNVDPAIGAVTVHGTQGDAGADSSCQTIGATFPYQFTGSGLLESQRFTFFYYVLP